MVRPEIQERFYLLLRALLAEFLGIFILTMVDAGIPMINFGSSDTINLLGRCFAPGFVIMAMIFSLGKVSGAHFNPAVTLSFALRKVFPWSKVPLYIGAQFLGATIASLCLSYLFGHELLELGATKIHGSTLVGAGLETLMSFFLIFTILSTAEESSIQGLEAAFPVGFSIIFCGLLGKSLTGASMNPARSFGPAIVSGHLDKLWVYLLMPIIGGILAIGWTSLIHKSPTEKEKKSSQGDSKASCQV